MTAGPVARLFGSLANALLDLGMPTIRDWLRDRLGASADVGQLTTDGAFVHLHGVRVPLGPRGMLTLDRATAKIVGLGAGAPEIRFHAGTGAIVFGDETSPSFRATVSFAALPEPDESAWIWGQLEIEGVSWTAREGGPSVKPMHGRARLFVSSREWRLEAGNLDGEIVRAHFVGAGVFEAASDGSRANDELLVPRVLSAAALTLEHARVGPFIDAVGALAGSRIDIPSFVPLDAELDGNLAWSSTEGGTVDLRIGSASIRATVRGSVGADGTSLIGRVVADVVPATILPAVGAPREATPRDDDVVHVELDAGGSFRGPTVDGMLRARELGFRLGRPRFVPPIVVRDLEAQLFLKEDRVVVRATASPNGGTVLLDLDAALRDPSSVRGSLRADGLDAAFLRDIARTLDANVAVPEDISCTLDLALAPTSVARGSPASTPRRSISGTVSVATVLSKISLTVTGDRNPRLTGTVATPDLIAAGLFQGTVRPASGAVEIDLDVDPSTFVARGSVQAKHLAIVVTHRPDLAPWIVEDAIANLTIDRSALAYEGLRFRSLGGGFLAHGSIPFRPASSPKDVPKVSLRVERGGLELMVAILDLVRAPPPKRWSIPADIGLEGRLEFYGRTDGENLRTDVSLTTPRGSALDLSVRLSGAGAFDGSTVRGALATRDLVAANVLPTAWISGEGTFAIDASVRGRGPTIVLVAAARADRIVLRTDPATEDAVLVVTNPSASLRVDALGVMWKELDAVVTSGPGRIASTGFVEWSGRSVARASVRSVVVHDLPAISGRHVGAFVRGDLSASVVVAMEEERGPRVAGDLTLDGATFPALDLLRPELARYGLRPPSEDAASPAKAIVVGNDWGLSFRVIAIDLRGAALRGEIGISRARTLDGRLEVTLEEEYLRTSKLLTLPRVLTERLVVPIDVSGPVDAPDVNADVATLLGRFIKESHVAQLFTSSRRMEERRSEASRRQESRPPFVDELGPVIDASIDAHASDWELAAQLRVRLF